MCIPVKQRLGKSAGWLGICVAHGSFFSGEAAVFVCRPGTGEPHSHYVASINSPCFFLFLVSSSFYKFQLCFGVYFFPGVKSNTLVLFIQNPIYI